MSGIQVQVGGGARGFGMRVSGLGFQVQDGGVGLSGFGV